MSPATQRVIPLTSATAQAAAEPLARPKVMRRPASFSSPAPVVAPTPATAPQPSSRAAALSDIRLSEQAEAAAPAAVPTPAARRWQEDARFGLVLALTLLILNTALILGLPHLRTAASATAPTQTASAAVAPAQAAGVTVYTNPTAPAPYTAEGVDGEARAAGLGETYHVLGSATDSGPNQ